MKKTISIKNAKINLKNFFHKNFFQRKVNSSIKPKMDRNKVKLSFKGQITINHTFSNKCNSKRTEITINGQVKLKRGKINMSRADNPHAFSRPENNLLFTENKIHFKCFYCFTSINEKY